MFTPVETTIGALLLHQATSNLLYQNGNILGASGFLRQLLSAPTKELLAFFTGMAASIIPLKALAPQSITHYPEIEMSPKSAMATAAIGLLIGWGTKMSNGCTSGHMLCGLSRLSSRSATAVAIFFPTALITHHLAHPTLSASTCPTEMPCYMPVYPSSEATLSLVMLATLSVLAARNIPSLVARVTTSDHVEEDGTEAHVAARNTTQFFSGLLFALGLHISQMAHPDKVAAFLSFPTLQHWDPSLALVMLFGVVPNLIENRAKGFEKPPLFAGKFGLPTKTFKDIDKRFVVGAAAFGIGWGLTGTCPGPAVLRALSQPVWGLVWISGFWLGGKLHI